MITFNYHSTVNPHPLAARFETPNKYRSLVASRNTNDTKRYDKNNVISLIQRIHKLNPSSKPNFSKDKNNQSY